MRYRSQVISRGLFNHLMDMEALGLIESWIFQTTMSKPGDHPRNPEFGCLIAPFRMLKEDSKELARHAKVMLEFKMEDGEMQKVATARSNTTEATLKLPLLTTEEEERVKKNKNQLLRFDYIEL